MILYIYSPGFGKITTVEERPLVRVVALTFITSLYYTCTCIMECGFHLLAVEILELLLKEAFSCSL